MANLKTLAELRDSARQTADMENDSLFISDAEANAYINDSIAELYNIMTEGAERQLFAKNSPILVKDGDFAYVLPDDFYKLASVHVYQNGRYEMATQGDPSEYPNLASQSNTYCSTIYRYFLRFNPMTGKKHIYVFPPPPNTELALTYVPSPPSLTSDSETIDGIAGWHEYIIVDAAIKMLQKEETDTQALELRKMDIKGIIVEHARSLDVHHPKSIRKMRKFPRG